jgi:hypothetical protein
MNFVFVLISSLEGRSRSLNSHSSLTIHESCHNLSYGSNDELNETSRIET